MWSVYIFIGIVLVILIVIIPDKYFLLPLGFMIALVLFGNNKR